MTPQNKKRSAIGALVVSAYLLVTVARREGYQGEEYIPVKGDRPTIGFGQTDGVRIGERTDPVRALITLENDLEGRKAQLAKCIHVPVSQNELNAAMSLSYNIGTEAFCNSTIVRRWNNHDYAGGCKAFLMWDKFHGRTLDGLRKRRMEEYQECIQ